MDAQDLDTSNFCSGELFGFLRLLDFPVAALQAKTQLLFRVAALRTISEGAGTTSEVAAGHRLSDRIWGLQALLANPPQHVTVECALLPSDEIFVCCDCGSALCAPQARNGTRGSIWELLLRWSQLIMLPTPMHLASVS